MSLLKSAPNFRDLGGLPTADGRSIRAGLVYRSDALDALDADDLAQLAALSPRVCCDLRSDGERLQRPHRWPSGAEPRVLNLAVATDIRVLMPELVRELRGNANEAGAVALMQHLYRDLPVVCVPVLRQVFALLLDDEAEHLPLVVNCTAGKDRTGFVIAMLLHALRVPDDAILADYLRSNAAANRASLQGKVARLLHELLGSTAPPDMLAAIIAARADYLDAAFSRIAADHGSVDRYLHDTIGLSAADRERLAVRLLVH